MSDINELIASEVMKYKLKRLAPRSNSPKYFEYYMDGKTAICAKGKYTPKTDMNQAIVALELFIEQSPKNVTPTIWFNSTCDLWVVEIAHTDACEYGKDLAETICKSILKAKKIEF